MLGKRDAKTLARLIQANGMSDVLLEMSVYAFGRIDGDNQAWPEIFSILSEAKARTRRASRAEECRILGLPYDPDED